MRSENKNFAYDYKDRTLRGSFINQVLIFTFVGLILIGVLFSDAIVARLVKLTELISLLFFISFGGWKTAQYFSKRQSKICDKEKEEGM